MATRKKTTEPKPKLYTLSEKQLKTLKDVAIDLMNIRRTLEDLEGQEDISTVMFKIGTIYNVTQQAETAMDELVDSYDGECDDCDEDNNW